MARAKAIVRLERMIRSIRLWFFIFMAVFPPSVKRLVDQLHDD
jgi:hypothetical protein